MALGYWPLANPKTKPYTLDGQRVKNSRFDAIRGQFDAIGSRSNVEFLGWNGNKSFGIIVDQ